MPKRVRTPNCTHVDMDRVYGRDQQCFVCGRQPSIGFLYECRQDCSASLHPTQHEEHKSPLRLELEGVGLNESVIRTAEQGHYSPAQLALLKTQKRDLKLVIDDSIQGSQINDAVALLAASNHDGTTNSKMKSPTACNFRACHTCRPYYRDRVYISITAVVTANFSPVSEADMQHLPTKSAQIMRSIGTLQNSATAHDDRYAQMTVTFASTDGHAPHTASTASDSSELTFKTTQTDADELRALCRPRRRFYNMGHRSSGEIARDLSRMPPLFTRQGLRTALQGIFRPGRDSSSSGSMITLPVPRTGTVRDASARPVGEFDMGALRRVRRQQERNELRNGTYAGGFEDVGTRQAISSLDSDAEGSCSSGSDFSVYSCISEGSEEGVTLADAGVSDNKMSDVASKSAIFIETRAVSYDDYKTDTGLQSIMAQV